MGKDQHTTTGPWWLTHRLTHSPEHETGEAKTLQIRRAGSMTQQPMPNSSLGGGSLPPVDHGNTRTSDRLPRAAVVVRHAPRVVIARARVPHGGWSAASAVVATVFEARGPDRPSAMDRPPTRELPGPPDREGGDPARSRFCENGWMCGGQPRGEGFFSRGITSHWRTNWLEQDLQNHL